MMFIGRKNLGLTMNDAKRLLPGAQGKVAGKSDTILSLTKESAEVSVGKRNGRPLIDYD